MSGDSAEIYVCAVSCHFGFFHAPSCPTGVCEWSVMDRRLQELTTDIVGCGLKAKSSEAEVEGSRKASSTIGPVQRTRYEVQAHKHS